MHNRLCGERGLRLFAPLHNAKIVLFPFVLSPPPLFSSTSWHRSMFCKSEIMTKSINERQINKNSRQRQSALLRLHMLIPPFQGLLPSLCHLSLYHTLCFGIPSPSVSSKRLYHICSTCFNCSRQCSNQNNEITGRQSSTDQIPYILTRTRQRKHE
jgi:hypothetical protein